MGSRVERRAAQAGRMSSRPPPLPPVVLQRVLVIASLDGKSVVALAGLGTIAAAVWGDVGATVAGGLIFAAGWLELRGVGLLRRRESRGVDLLVFSQLALLAVIWGYVAHRLVAGSSEVLDAVLTPERLHELARRGVDTDLLKTLIRRIMPVAYGAVALVSLAYQGGMAWFFHRQRRAIQAALK